MRRPAARAEGDGDGARVFERGHLPRGRVAGAQRTPLEMWGVGQKTEMGLCRTRASCPSRETQWEGRVASIWDRGLMGFADYGMVSKRWCLCRVCRPLANTSVALESDSAVGFWLSCWLYLESGSAADWIRESTSAYVCRRLRSRVYISHFLDSCMCASRWLGYYTYPPLTVNETQHDQMPELELVTKTFCSLQKQNRFRCENKLFLSDKFLISVRSAAGTLINRLSARASSSSNRAACCAL